jgi:hypothetical protein
MTIVRHVVLHSSHLLPQEKQHVRSDLASGMAVATFYLKERSHVQGDQKTCSTNFSPQPYTEVKWDCQLHALSAFLPAKGPLAARGLGYLSSRGVINVWFM